MLVRTICTRTERAPTMLRPRPLIPVLAMTLLGAGSITLGARSEPREPDQRETPQAPEIQSPRECVVTLPGGRRLTGILMESREDEIVLRINGIDTTFQRSRISSIDFLPPIEERFERLRAAVPDEDIDARIALVNWLRDRRAYVIAIEELDSILESDPDNPDALVLHRWLTEHLKLMESRLDRDDADRERAKSRRVTQAPTLSEDQINLIRVYEIDLDHPPKLKVDDDIIRTLMARDPSSFPVDPDEREEMLEMSDLDKLRLLFSHRARDLYGRVRVQEDPRSIDLFKDHIAGPTGWLMNACATTRCHGGTEAGGFQLLTRRPNTDETLYTNFLIVDRATLKDGTPLINVADPARSPLIQLAMVQSKSIYPHPEIDPLETGQRFRPVFRTTRDRGYTRAIEWIRSLYTPRPDYGIEYPPPGEAGTGEAPDADDDAQSP